MDLLNATNFWVTFAARFFTIGASSIAIWVFFTRRGQLAVALQALTNYASNLAIQELKSKLERLNDYDADEEKHRKIILYLLSDIEGQLQGNSKLKMQLEPDIQEISLFTSRKKKLKETDKRIIVSRLREALREVESSNTTLDNRAKN